MRSSRSQKSLIGGILIFLLLLLTANTSSATEPVYAGWAVGSSWDGYGTILRSTDSGKTWIRQGAGQIADVSLESVFAPGPYTAWAVGASDSGYATVYHTTDGGSTWERKGSSNSASVDYIPDVELEKVHVVGNSVWVVGSPGTILHTSDSGATWTNHTPVGYENIHLQGVYALNSNTVWVTGGSDIDNHAVILKTTDAGLTWTRQTGGDVLDTQYILGISAADANTAWAVGHTYVILKTTNGGTTWTRHPDFGGLGDINEVYAVNTSTVWVATDNEIVWSTDGGTTWGHSGEHGLSGSIAFMGISAVNAQKAWGSYIGFNFKTGITFGYIAYTTDGGITWTKIEQLDGEDLPGLPNISFATRPINYFPWNLYLPAFTGKDKK